MLANKLLPLMIKTRTAFTANHLLVRHSQLPALIPQRSVASKSYNFHDADGWISKRIGNRETVGYGMNGEPEYFDRVDFPFPSIRYKRPTAEVQALREKEKGDWRLLSIEEKKAIYRANFCQTFAEFQAPTGEWMCIAGVTLIITSACIWLFILMKLYVYRRTMPRSFLVASQMAQLARMLTLRMNPVLGISSKWDYEKKKWKSKPWYIPWDDPFAGVQCEEDVID